MAEKLRLGPEVRELKIGSSFLNSKTAFHTLRYDFKPASVVSGSKHASVEIGPNQEVTVTHHETTIAPQTVFKGSQRPYNKECVLIIDRSTGEITLEKLHTNIQLKKTRQEAPKYTSYSSSGRPPTPVEKKPSPPQRERHRSKQNNTNTSRNSPLHASPSYPHRSPTLPHIVHKSPPPVSSLSLSPSPVGGSLPILGLDDPNDNSTNSFDISNALPDLKASSPDFPGINFNEEENGLHEVGILSDSSSESSSDSNSSDSESESQKPTPKAINGHVNGKSSPLTTTAPEHLLNEDLQLSESGSDSD